MSEDVTDQDGAFWAPDFMDLLSPSIDDRVLFECTSRHPDGDGSLTVTADTVYLGCEDGIDEIPIDRVNSWSVADDGSMFALIVQADGTHHTLLIADFRVAAVAVMSSISGPIGEVPRSWRR